MRGLADHEPMSAYSGMDGAGQVDQPQRSHCASHQQWSEAATHRARDAQIDLSGIGETTLSVRRDRYHIGGYLRGCDGSSVTFRDELGASFHPQGDGMTHCGVMAVEFVRSTRLLAGVRMLTPPGLASLIFTPVACLSMTRARSLPRLTSRRRCARLWRFILFPSSQSSPDP